MISFTSRPLNSHPLNPRILRPSPSLQNVLICLFWIRSVWVFPLFFHLWQEVVDPCLIHRSKKQSRISLQNGRLSNHILFWIHSSSKEFQDPRSWHHGDTESAMRCHSDLVMVSLQPSATRVCAEWLRSLSDDLCCTCLIDSCMIYFRPHKKSLLLNNKSYTDTHYVPPVWRESGREAETLKHSAAKKKELDYISIWQLASIIMCCPFQGESGQNNYCRILNISPCHHFHSALILSVSVALHCL